MISKAEYENKIYLFKVQISNSIEEINFLEGEIRGLKMRVETSKDGQAWKARAINSRNVAISQEQKKIETAKQNLWDFEKQIAKDEQEAQIKAMREAIADQVRLEQEKIIQSEENQKILINEPIQTTEPIKEKSFALGSLSLVALAIGGFLVLR